MEFEQFVRLGSSDIASIVAGHFPGGLGVAVHFDGTRRWYMNKFGVDQQALYSDAYATATMREIRRVSQMIFEDGVSAVYCPALGIRIENERGPEYARFQIEKFAQQLTEPEMLDWCASLGVELSCYGATGRLPAGPREQIESLAARTRSTTTKRYMRWSVFAGSPHNDVFGRVVKLYESSGRAPSDIEVIEQYYAGPHIPVGIWIGHKSPAVHGVPLLVNSRTNLYFLLFPTLLIEPHAWRRVLFDALFVRGEQSSLHPDDVPSERRILGLGARVNGCWHSTPELG